MSSRVAIEYRKRGHYDDQGRAVLEWTNRSGELVRATLEGEGFIRWNIIAKPDDDHLLTTHLTTTTDGCAFDDEADQ